MAGFVFAGCLIASVSHAAVKATIFATGLNSPAKLIVTPAGNLLVSEGGERPSLKPPFVPNQGRISIVDRQGQVRPLLDHLPSGLDLDQVNPGGPSALWLEGSRTLYVVIGPGDSTRRTPANQEVPNPAGLSSALFNSLWRVQFSESVDRLRDGFSLNPAIDYATLSDGAEVDLTNNAGAHATIEVLADFRSLYPAAPPNIVSASNPFGLLFEKGSFYLPDAGQNSVVKIPVEVGRPQIKMESGHQQLKFSVEAGHPQTITHFPPVPNTAGFGPPVSQAVPNSIRGFSRHFALVSLLSGFPFGPGAASVRLVNLEDGTQQPFITGLTTAIDVLPYDCDRDSGPLLVLEYARSFNPANRTFIGPGRVLRFVTPSAAPEVLVDSLTTPTSMAIDPHTHELFITEIDTGQIIRVIL